MFADDVKKRSGGKLGRFAAISGMPLLLIVQAIGLEGRARTGSQIRLAISPSPS